MRRLRALSWVAVGIALVAVFGAAAWWRMPKSDVSVFEVSNLGWGELRLRLESEGSDLLLLTRANPESSVPHERTGSVYRYDPTANTLSKVPKAAWDDASGQIARSDVPRNRPHGWGVTRENGVFFAFGGSMEPWKLETTGERVLWRDTNVAGDAIALLTVDGELDPPFYWWFFSRSGGYRGQHYVELFTLPEWTRKRPAVPIPLNTANGLESAYWSADGKYVVYSANDGKRLCIIRTDVQGE